MSLFELKGSLFALTVLRLKSADLQTLRTELAAKLAQAPAFFENAPIVIDLHPIQTINPPIDFDELKTMLTAFHLIPIGVRNGSAQHHENAAKIGLAILPNLKIHETSEATTETTEMSAKSSAAHTEAHADKKEAPLSFTKIITEPIRSGKQVYVKGDLLILAPVSHGAEILADGNIHVYAPLRGRVLAGVRGNTQARIFCKQLDAELISIAGHYKTNDELETIHRDSDTLKHVYLDGDEIKITEI